MADESVITSTPEDSGKTETTTVEDVLTDGTSFDITKYINTDGTFKDGYKDGLIPDELRGNKVYDIPKDIQSVLKMVGHQSITLGKYGSTKGVLPINEKSTPSEIEAFRSAVGVPKDSSGYKYTAPEHSPITPQQQKEVFDLFNKSNFTQGQVDTAMGLYNQRVAEAQKEYNTRLQTMVEEAEDKIRNKWGNKYDERLLLSKSFISKMTGQMTPDEYDDLFGKEIEVSDVAGNITKSREGGINSAEFSPIRAQLLDLFSNIEEKYGIQDSAVISESGSTISSSIREQIVELEATPGFMDGKLKQSLDQKDRDKHDEIMRKRDILYGKL